jgi:hypothetical protein
MIEGIGFDEEPHAVGVYCPGELSRLDQVKRVVRR